MSSNILTGKCAAAFRTLDDQIIYCIFERSYRKNDEPAPGQWCCMCVGTYDEVLKWIFIQAIRCEEGILRGHAPITPENFINAWKRELANPVEMEDVTISLAVGNSFRAVNADNIGKLVNVLMQCGRADLIAQFETSAPHIQLIADYKIVIALCGVDGFIQPWHFFSKAYAGTNICKDLAPVVAKSKVTPPKYEVYKVGRNSFLVKIGDNPWRSMGPIYGAVGLFILNEAYPLELLSSGSAVSMITVFRATCENALPLPGNTLVTVYTHMNEINHWRNSEAKELVAHFLGRTSKDDLPTQAYCLYQQIAMSELGLKLFHLVPEQVVWDVPDQPTSTRPMSTSKVATQPVLF